MNSDPNWNGDPFSDVLGLLIELLAKASNVDPPLQTPNGSRERQAAPSSRTCPSAGPSGGEGDALPAGMYMRSEPSTFFAAMSLQAPPTRNRNLHRSALHLENYCEIGNEISYYWNRPSAHIGNCIFETDKHDKLKKMHCNCCCCCSVSSACYIVEVPVERDTPGVADGVLQLLPEVLQCHGSGLPEAERVSDVVDVVAGAQLWDAAREHHGEEVEEERATMTQLQKRILTDFLETERNKLKDNRSDRCRTYLANSADSLVPSLVMM